MLWFVWEQTDVVVTRCKNRAPGSWCTVKCPHVTSWQHYATGLIGHVLCFKSEDRTSYKQITQS